MKITKSQLQRIIKEELQQIMSEQQTTMAQDTARGEQRRSYQDILDDANMLGGYHGTAPMPFPISIPGIATMAAAIPAGIYGLDKLDQALGGASEERELAAQDREYREGPAPDVAVGGVGMMSPKERAEVARLRGTGPRPPSGPSPEQISVARSMMDPQRQRGTLSPGEVARLSTGAFTEPELQQMQVRESLINDLTEAVLAKLMK